MPTGQNEEIEDHAPADGYVANRITRCSVSAAAAAKKLLLVV
jgi:hypothetical protein